MIVSSACSDDPTTSASNSTSNSTTGSSSSTTPASATAPVDANAALQQGLAGLAAGYHFHSEVAINGVVTLTADGDRVGDSTRLTLVGEGGTVVYIITPTGSHAQPEFGDWELLDVAPAVSDPILALSTPLAVSVASVDEVGNVVLRVTVTLVSLGIASEGNADVDVTLANGVITRITYAATVGGSPAITTSVFSPLVDTTPIVAPI